MQAVKKCAAQSGSPAQDGLGVKFVKYRWWLRSGCNGLSMAKKFNNNNSGQFVLPHPTHNFFSPWPSCAELPDWAAPFLQLAWLFLS